MPGCSQAFEWSDGLSVRKQKSRELQPVKWCHRLSAALGLGSLNGLVVDELDSRGEGEWHLTRSKLYLKPFVFLQKSVKGTGGMEADHSNIDPARLKCMNALD